MVELILCMCRVCMWKIFKTFILSLIKLHVRHVLKTWSSDEDYLWRVFPCNWTKRFYKKKQFHAKNRFKGDFNAILLTNEEVKALYVTLQLTKAKYLHNKVNKLPIFLIQCLVFGQGKHRSAFAVVRSWQSRNMNPFSQEKNIQHWQKPWIFTFFFFTQIDILGIINGSEICLINQTSAMSDS